MKNKNTRDKSSKNYGNFLFGFVLILVLIAIIFAVITFFAKFNGNNDNNGDIGNFIAIFAILITAIAVILPITSYTIKKDDVKKITDEFNEAIAKVTEDYDKYKSEITKTHNDKICEFDDKIKSLDIQHIELLESLIRRDNTSSIIAKEPYAETGMEYVNALILFENGAYDESKSRIRNAITTILDTKLYDVGKNEERDALLIYKVFDLYRKISGRTRFFNSGLLNSFDKLIDKLDANNKLLYKTIIYLKVKSELDKVEKSFDKIDIKRLIELDDIEKIKYDALLYNTLTSRKYYVLAYYYDADNRKEYYRKAIDFATQANLEIQKRKNDFSIGMEKEVEKILINDSSFTIAKVLEKSSYVVANIEKKNLLNISKEIVEQLLKEKTNAKYYLELSEILKKNEEIEESDKAAQYGYLLAPTDPLLAAQCAYVSFRDYLKDRTNRFNLNKAQELINTAHWVYDKEKTRYKNHINVKFSYIASMSAIILTYKYIDSKAAITVETIKNCISKDIDNSIIDNANNVPNYKRALIIFWELYNYCKEPGVKAFCFNEAKRYIDQFKDNNAFNFRENENFYEFSTKLKEIANQEFAAEQLMNELKVLLSPFENHI